MDQTQHLRGHDSINFSTPLSHEFDSAKSDMELMPIHQISMYPHFCLTLKE